MLLACFLLTVLDPELIRVLNASKALRGRTEVPRTELKALRGAVRAWLEARMPRTDGLREELQAAGMMGSETGRIARLEVLGPAAVVGLAVPCGSSDAVYLAGRPLRELGGEDTNSTVMGVHTGGGLTLVARREVQCNSFWNQLSYEVYRGAVRVFAGRHSIWLGEGSYTVDLQPDELTIRLQSNSIDPGLLIRTHVLRYRLRGGKATRLDPVALEPRDFVDEWLTQPWSVMRSRSEPGLETWHRRLYSAEGVFGEFEWVRERAGKPGDWEVKVALEPPACFVVRQSGEAFRMLAVGRCSTR